MSVSYQTENTTPISMLPDINDLEPSQDSKYNKYIRDSHIPDNLSGMNTYTQPITNIYSENQDHVKTNDNINHTCMVNCSDFHNHFKNCPVCSEFYSRDRSYYIVIIGILFLFCVFLIKRNMELNEQKRYR